MTDTNDEQVQTAPPDSDQPSLLSLPWPIRRERLRQMQQTNVGEGPDEG